MMGRSPCFLLVVVLTVACARSRPTPASIASPTSSPTPSALPSSPPEAARTGDAPPTSPTLPVGPHPPNASSCAAEPLRQSGRIHYVCDCQPGAAPGCTPGSDDNDGRSSRRPLRSYPKAAATFAELAAGDTVAFCRGGRWQVTHGAEWSNRGCRKNKTCDIRDYPPPWGKGNEAKPSLWIDGGREGSSLISFMHEPQHYEGYRVLNLDLHGSPSDTGIFFYNETTNVDLCNLDADGFGISVQVAGSDKPEYGVCSNIVLRQSVITNNSNIAYLGVCDNCSVEDNIFDNNGVSDVFTHSVYFASHVFKVDGQFVVHTTQGMRLSRNAIHHSRKLCRGAPVVVHGRQQDVIMEDNLVDAVQATDACWGLGVGCGGYGYGCWFRNVIIRNNVVKNLGNVGSDDSNCNGCTIENNLFLMNRDGTAISVGSGQARPAGDPDYTQWDGSPDQSAQAVVIRNNTIYFGTAATAATGVTLESGIAHVIENNAIAFAGPSGKRSEHTCYRLPVAPRSDDPLGLSLVSADYNLCSVSDDDWVAYQHQGRVLALAAWQETGFDRHSRQAEPRFRNPPTDFVPAPGSPLIGAGKLADGPQRDLAGKPRPDKPAIGALEPL